MSSNPTFVYFFDRNPDIEEKHLIHTTQCSHLPQKSDLEYIGIAQSPLVALRRAEITTPKKTFILCPDCCDETEFES